MKTSKGFRFSTKWCDSELGMGNELLWPSSTPRGGRLPDSRENRVIPDFKSLTAFGLVDNVCIWMNTTATLKTTSTMFRALADESRVRLLNLLLEGECCVCDLGSVLALPQPSISRHLTYLKRAGLVTIRREGKWRHYAIPDDLNGVRATLLDCVRCSLRKINVLQRDLACLRRSRANRNRCE